MRPRVVLGKFLIFLGRFIQSLPVIVMKPNDLIEFSRRHYAGKDVMEKWCSSAHVDLGLNSNEKFLLGKIPLKRGRLLALDVGGGREAFSRFPARTGNGSQSSDCHECRDS